MAVAKAATAAAAVLPKGASAIGNLTLRGHALVEVPIGSYDDIDWYAVKCFIVFQLIVMLVSVAAGFMLARWWMGRGAAPAAVAAAAGDGRRRIPQPPRVVVTSVLDHRENTEVLQFGDNVPGGIRCRHLYITEGGYRRGIVHTGSACARGRTDLPIRELRLCVFCAKAGPGEASGGTWHYVRDDRPVSVDDFQIFDTGAEADVAGTAAPRRRGVRTDVAT